MQVLGVWAGTIAGASWLASGRKAPRQALHSDTTSILRKYGGERKGLLALFEEKAPCSHAWVWALLDQSRQLYMVPASHLMVMVRTPPMFDVNGLRCSGLCCGIRGGPIARPAVEPGVAWRLFVWVNLCSFLCLVGSWGGMQRHAVLVTGCAMGMPHTHASHWPLTARVIRYTGGRGNRGGTTGFYTNGRNMGSSQARGAGGSEKQGGNGAVD